MAADRCQKCHQIHACGSHFDDRDSVVVRALVGGWGGVRDAPQIAPMVWGIEDSAPATPDVTTLAPCLAW